MNNDHESGDNLVGLVLDRRWKITRRLGSGAFGVIYKAHKVNDRDRVVAVKTERIGQRATLQNESEFYQCLGGGVPGFPSFYGFSWTPSYSHRAIVISLLEESLSNLFQRYNRRLWFRTVLIIAVQALKLLKTLHETGYVHRDIKPSNMMIGRRDPSVIHLVDFGIATRYKCERHNRHIADDGESHGIRGTLVYASINNHRGRRLTRRDDLESLAYTLIHLAKGSLPWSRMHCRHAVLQSKESSSSSDVCGDLPSPYRKLLRKAKRMRFAERPDYRSLWKMFQFALEKRGWSLTDKFEWM